MLVISTQNWSILAKFARKNPGKSVVFYWLFLGEVSLRNFSWNRPIFPRICPWKSFEIWLFAAKPQRNRPIMLWILTFLPRNRPIFFANFDLFSPRKSREIGRFFREFAPENPAKFCFFFREISEALFLESGSKSSDTEDNIPQKKHATDTLDKVQCICFYCCYKFLPYFLMDIF